MARAPETVIMLLESVPLLLSYPRMLTAFAWSKKMCACFPSTHVSPLLSNSQLDSLLKVRESTLTGFYPKFKNPSGLVLM